MFNDVDIMSMSAIINWRSMNQIRLAVPVPVPATVTQ